MKTAESCVSPRCACDHSGEQGKATAVRLSCLCVYRKNIKSTMGNSLPFPKLINFSTCWQIFTWTGWSSRDECVNQQQVGSGVCLAQLLFRAVPVLSRYRSPASVTERDCRLSVTPGAWRATASPLSPDSSTPWGREQRE